MQFRDLLNSAVPAVRYFHPIADQQNWLLAFVVGGVVVKFADWIILSADFPLLSLV
jgi:hypothetical protein